MFTIDTHPLVLAADALTLVIDKILLAARPRVVDYTSTATAKESLAPCGHNLLGLGVNGMLMENMLAGSPPFLSTFDLCRSSY